MKKNILILFILMVLIVPFKVGAAELEKSFEMSFDTNNFRLRIINSYDEFDKVNGYIIFDTNGGIYEKYDLEDRLLFSTENATVDDLKVEEVDDDLIITRIDTVSGNSLWQNKFGGNGYDYCSKILYDYDTKGNVTGYLLVVLTRSTDLDIIPGDYIIKYDVNGNLLWIKPYHTSKLETMGYVKNKDDDLLEFSARHSEYGDITLSIFNKTKNTALLNKYLDASTTSAEFFWYDEYVIFILFGYDDFPTMMLKYNYDGTKSLEKELKSYIKPNMLINSRTIDGDFDGFISVDSVMAKFDYDGNLIWENPLSYTPTHITESYDETGEFDGYIVVGADWANDKGYITKFTYPKRVIESNSDDVEVVTGSYPGKNVTLTPKEKAGYYVKRIIVRDSTGKEIEVSSDNTFVMPDDDVTIEVIYEKRETETIINPDTASTISIVLVIMSILVLGTIITKKTKYQ